MSLQSWLLTARTHPDDDQQCRALDELVSQWREQSETYQALYDLSTCAESWRVREKALRLLSEVAMHSDPVCQLAKDRAQNDLDSRVRYTSVEILPQVWLGDQKSLAKELSTWARTSNHADVRHAALLELCATGRNTKAVLDLLIDRAKNEKDPTVRAAAVENLADGWGEDATVYQLLCKLAKDDADPDVKRAANKIALPKVRVFFSYSHEDKQHAQRLVTYILNELKRDRIELWSDERIATGTLWDNEIKSRIKESDIALVLVSQAFLNSSYCQKVEVQSFLKQRKYNGMVIFPIILSACSWDSYDWLSSTQYLPPSGKNIKSHYAASGKKEELFNTIVSHLRQIARDEIRHS